MLINPTFYDISQNSEDWDELRCGMLTASMCSDLYADKKTKTYQDVITKVSFERVTGKQQKNFSNKWMEYGHETEPEAEENYVIETFNSVENAGFWKANDWFGASPDRKIIGENGGCEFKCPSFSTYREYLENYDSKQQVILPKSYSIQVHAQMLATGWDFIDYMPYISPNVRQLITRVYRDEAILKDLTLNIEDAINDIILLINKIKR
jgi:hypothetical protein